MDEVNSCGSEFAETLVRDEHLTQGVEAIGSSPGFFHGFNVLGLRNRSAYAVRRAELSDVWHIVHHGMLAGKGDGILANTLGDKDGTFSMKRLERRLHGSEGWAVQNVPPCEIAEVEEVAQSAYHLSGHEPQNRRDVHLRSKYLT